MPMEELFCFVCSPQGGKILFLYAFVVIIPKKEEIRLVLNSVFKTLQEKTLNKALKREIKV